MSKDHGKLRHVFGLVRPKLIFVEYGQMFEAALAALDLSDVEVVVAAAPPAAIKTGSFAGLARPVTPAVDAAYAATGPDTVAKILFTSGSTGLPKGVINTQRMLCANQRMSESVLLPDPDNPPVLLDWLPWNHTFGGNYNFNLVLRQGGTLHIDGGRPLPGMFEQTIANLREISPTQYSNVPSAFAMLAPVLDADAGLRQTFFRDLKVLAYGGASMPNELWQHYQELAVRTLGERIVFITGWGSTETAPTATTVHWQNEGPGIIGLPFPGVELKMVPVGGTYELRLRGPIVTPGYLKRPDLTAEAFDEEGFYKIGDAGHFVDPADPTQGLTFDGRVVEDFKLETGTWVHVGGVRVKALGATQPALQDAVVAGQDRPYIALLAWPNLAALRDICTDAKAKETVDGLLASREVVEFVRAGLRRHNAEAGGSSVRVARVLLLREPPSIDGNEITDKGYINQRATLQRRASLVEKLYANPPPADVIVI
jgi:feruloyl-CoA synthase